jgi:hypothetical protein
LKRTTAFFNFLFLIAISRLSLLKTVTGDGGARYNPATIVGGESVARKKIPVNIPVKI